MVKVCNFRTFLQFCPTFFFFFLDFQFSIFFYYLGLRNSGVHSTKSVRGVKDETRQSKMPLAPLSGRERFKVKIGKMFNSAKRNPNVDSELNPNNLLGITDK